MHARSCPHTHIMCHVTSQVMRVAETRRAKDLLRKLLQDEKLLEREHVTSFQDPGESSMHVCLCG